MNALAPESDSANKLRVRVIHYSNLYTDDTGRFPFQARSDKQYVMVTYHLSNIILGDPFKFQKDTFRLTACDLIMQRFKDKGLTMDLQILDNKCIREYEG